MRVVEKAAAAVAAVLAALVKVEARETAALKAELRARAVVVRAVALEKGAVVRAADLTAAVKAVAKAVVETVAILEAPTAAADGPRRPARGLQSRP